MTNVIKLLFVRVTITLIGSENIVFIIEYLVVFKGVQHFFFFLVEGGLDDCAR